ncbi:7711_t:CDS:2 [Dentiscutata erythropus]|uniref:7711_t:CDS:1 n=1 Tax=Dentiscutata erythropus TaxID=1348616 RepID=A0A9N9NFM3_9GLOM|nr:7711_t:CDS:2 [Dentiscutata erythropus]
MHERSAEINYGLPATFGVILALLVMFFGYNLKLSTHMAKLEEKNGSRQKQIDELKKEIEQLKQGVKN